MATWGNVWSLVMYVLTWNSPPCVTPEALYRS